MTQSEGGSARQRSRQRGNSAKARGAAPAPKRGVFTNTINDINRLREIIAVLGRHGFAGLLRRSGLAQAAGLELEVGAEEAEPLDTSDRPAMARRVRRVLQDLGATFIKLGQILSTRHDLLPRVYLEELEKLQDQVTPVPFAAIQAQIEEALGAPLEALFAQVTPEPLATASIGQVHRAVTLEGRAVVIKVQRPGIAAQVRGDLDLLYFVAKLLEATVEEAEFYRFTELVSEFDRTIQQELDFLHEARNVRRFRQAYQGQARVVVPEALEVLCARTVLTLEYLEGEKLSKVAPGTAAAEALVETLLELAYQQIFVEGMFHGDPHPGNVLVLGPGRVGLLDFGLVGRLSRAQQDDLVGLVLAIVYGDVDGIARALLRMGQAGGRVHLGALRREIAGLREEYLRGSLGEIDLGAFASDLMDLALRFRVRLTGEYALLVKATVTLEGVLRRLQPELDIVEAASPMARRLMQERYSGPRLMQEVFQGANTLGGFLREVPAQMDQILLDMESGAVAINVRHDQLQALGANLSQLGTRIFLGLVSGGLIVGGSVMLAQLDYRPREIPVLLFVAVGFFGGAAAVALAALAWPWLQARARRVRLTRVVSLWRRLRG
jgi:ubiquinone biosynthesis protein